MIQLSHIGEHLIATMLNESLSARELVVGIGGLSDWEFIPEIRLNRCGNLIFDGTHKVDISALNNSSKKCVAIEAKLGLDRLSKNEFNKRFIAECGMSHNASRVTGSMISILDGLLPKNIANESISVTHDKKYYEIKDSWVLIAREAVIQNWERNGSPNLSNRCKIVSLERVINTYGGKQTFNSLVSRLLTTDFYRTWFEKT